MAKRGVGCDKGLVVPRDERVAVRKSLLIIAALAALVVAGASSGAPAAPVAPLPFVVGATEDQVLSYDDGGAAIYSQMTSHLLGAIAVSPKGDDRPGSARNTISPVRFIKAVGDAYRKSGRKKPIMDDVALHPYPFVNTDPPDKGAPWPQVSVANLDRAEQAFWDGFNGTAQPTFEEAGVQRAQSGAPVKWLLDEAGWQTDTHGLPGYFGSENTPTIDEATQAQYYRQVIQRYACDNHVAALLFFHWIDEADRDRP